MRKGSLFALLLALWWVSTGASIIDKETKQGVMTLDQKISSLSQAIGLHHTEEFRRLDEMVRMQTETTRRLNGQTDLIEKILQRLRALEAQPTTAAKPPVQTLTPPVVIPPPTPDQTIATPTPPPSMKASTPLPPPTMQVDRNRISELEKEFSNQIKRSQNVSLLASFLAGGAVLLLIIFSVVTKRREIRTQKMIWQSEVESLRDTMNRERPHLKIQTNEDGISLVNDGELSADEIKFSLGPTPSNMKQRLRTPSKIIAGEKIEIPLQPHRSDDLLYATIEYKNPVTGRIYKDHFSIRVDRLTGEFIPVQQAS